MGWLGQAGIGALAGGLAALVLVGLHELSPSLSPFLVTGSSAGLDFMTGALGGGIAIFIEHWLEKLIQSIQR